MNEPYSPNRDAIVSLVGEDIAEDIVPEAFYKNVGFRLYKKEDGLWELQSRWDHDEWECVWNTITKASAENARAIIARTGGY